MRSCDVISGAVPGTRNCARRFQEALCTARLPRERQLRRSSSMHACHAKGSRGPSDHARRSSSRRLCVLHLPRERQPRPQRRPRAPQLLQRLCEMRLPRERQPRPQRRPRVQEALSGSVNYTHQNHARRSSSEAL